MVVLTTQARATTWPTLQPTNARCTLCATPTQEMEWKPLDRGSYSVQAPGMTTSVRATKIADVFDYHCDSHLSLSLGGCLFESLATTAARDADEDGEPCSILS